MHDERPLRIADAGPPGRRSPRGVDVVIGTGAVLGALRERWRAVWPAALADWSPFTKLSEPRWCLTRRDEAREQLTGSFAMIRLTDHAVVISLRQIHDLDLDDFARQVMAHEVGHHVYAPGDLRDNARLLARIRAGLPTRESCTGLVANLYTDLLINDRLQRGAGVDMGAVYRALRGDPSNAVWQLYMRLCEVLWRLPAGTLTPAVQKANLDLDAGLGARVIRAYGKDWLAGAGRFATLVLPYLIQTPDSETGKLPMPWVDADRAGAGDELPDGLAGIEREEQEGAIHPADDAELSGLDEEPAQADEEGGTRRPGDGGRATLGGTKSDYRDPDQYRELAKSLGVTLPDKELTVRYYRERALPHLVRFPVREVLEASDPLPEGLDTWDVGEPVPDIDWVESVARSPHVIPGVTTVRRLFGTTEGTSPERVPLDLYVGIDCSGSMSNPAMRLSYPVLAGAIIAMSALRTGAQVMACLSGEPGEFSETDGFVRSETAILTVLTGYLGTGFAFGVARLEATFVRGEARSRPTHILVVSDQDLFTMLKHNNGWQTAADAVERARGGATCVLEVEPRRVADQITRLRSIGWDVHTVRNETELLAFARAFSRAKYGGPSRGRRAAPPAGGATRRTSR